MSDPVAITPIDRAIGAAFLELVEIPGYKGALVIVVTDADKVIARSSFPGHLVDHLIEQLALHRRGERAGIIVVPS